MRSARKYKNIEVRGVVYPDANAVAEAFGVTVGQVRTAVCRGRLDSIGTGHKQIPVTIRGVSYPNFSAAGLALGVHGNTVRAAYYKGTLHRVGTGRVGVEPMRVRIAGKDFKNVAAAAKHFGVERGTVYSAISDGDPDRIARPQAYNPWRSKPFKIGDLTFPSMSAASRALGFKSDNYIALVMLRGSRKGREKILAAAMSYAASANCSGGAA